MNKKIFWFAVYLSLGICPALSLNAKEGNAEVQSIMQERNISGKVVDVKGEPVIGANVLIVGQNKGVITDVDGNFSLTVPQKAVIRVSYIGYITQEVTIDNKTSYTIELVEDAKSLDEVVVVGYGTMKKADVTSAVASVKSDEFLQGATKDVTQLISGKIAGLSVITPSGDPTQGTEIMLRGVSTLKSGTSPLILIDGVPGDLNTVAPDDIESIDVLKDGSAAAIYGTRGTNGVIIITTKQVKGVVKPTLSYSGKVSMQKIAGKLDFMSADQYRTLMKDVSGFVDWGGKTDWLDLITCTPISHEHNLSFKSGSDKASLISNVNFKDNEGIFLRTGTTDFKARIEGMYKILNDRLTFNLSLLSSIREYWPGFSSEVYRQAIMRNPTDVPFDADGNYVDRPEVYWYYNPIQSIQETNGEYKRYYTQLNGSATLKIIDGLDAKVLLSRMVTNSHTSSYKTSKHVDCVRQSRDGIAGRSYAKSLSDLMEITLNYNKTIKDHTISALAGYSYQRSENESFNASNFNFTSDSYQWNNLGDGAGLKQGLAGMGSSKNSDKLIGFFARLSYNYNNRYLLMGSLRYEGSSRFGADHKWGLFPSISAGWRINEEAFLNNVDWINELKLRVGYGVTGINLYSSYQSLSGLVYSSGSQFWTSGGWIPQLVPARNANPNLRWEKKHETNVGLDYGFLNNRIYGTVDFYVRRTVDALWDYDVPMPPYVYNKMMANVGELKNHGFEISIGAIPVKTTDFEWNTVLNYSTNSNKLVSLSNDEFVTQSNFVDFGDTGEPIQTSTHRLEVGGKVGNFWGWKTVDIDQDGIWIIETPNGERISYKDAKPEHKQVIGNGLPKHYLSWNNTLKYKGFDLGINIRGAFGFDILNFPRMYYENPKLAQYNRLQTAFDPIFGKDVTLNNDLALVSYYIEKGNYIKVDNISLGYTFKLKKNPYVKDLRLFLSGTNLLTISGYKGIDPEVNTVGLTPGNDYRDKYPTTRTFTLGLNITL